MAKTAHKGTSTPAPTATNEAGTTKVAGAQPGTEDTAGKKPKKEKRAAHPNVGNPDTKIYPFTEAPGDFNFDTHKPLKKKDFATDAAFFFHRAAEHDFRAAKLRKLAEESKAMGSTKERAKAKRLVKMQEKIAELRKQLEAQGVDVNALLAVGADSE